MLGTDFPYRDFYPKDATIVQIDLRGDTWDAAASWTSASWRHQDAPCEHCYPS